MRRDVSRRIRTLHAAGLLLALSGGVVNAQEFTYTATDCSGLKLKDAVGVPSAPKHTYSFSGSCKVFQQGSSSTYGVHTFPAEAYVKWDAAGGQLYERFSILGGFKYGGQIVGGQLESRYLCNDDPLIRSAACNGVDHKNGTGLEALSNPYKEFRPITKGKTTLAEASALAQQHATSSPPPPPPPSPTTATTSRRLQSPVTVDQAVAPISTPTPTPTANTSSQPREVRVSPPPPPEPSVSPPAETEQVLASGSHIPLQDGLAIVARTEQGELRWAMLGSDGEVKRLFPAGSRVLRSSQGQISVDWGGGVYRAGQVRKGRLRHPQKQH